MGFFQVRKYSAFFFDYTVRCTTNISSFRFQKYILKIYHISFVYTNRCDTSISSFHFRSFVLKMGCVFLDYPGRHTTSISSFSFPKLYFRNIVHFFCLSYSLHYEYVMFFIFKKHIKHKHLMKAYIHCYEIIVLYFLSNVNTFLEFL